jgi:hypothetical protein
MGAALETVVGNASTPSSTYTALTMNTGDSLTVRNFPPANPAYLMALFRHDATAGVTRLRSPLLHDNVKGIHLALSENPSEWGYPIPGVQTLKPQDTLIGEVTGSASTLDVMGVSIYYTNLPGSAARLHQYGDFHGMIKNIVTVEVAVTNSGTAGVWTDTVITTTDNLLHANTDYAVLGMYCDTAIGIIGIKGIDTGNLRVCKSGVVNTYESSQYFKVLSERSGLPCIPVFNAANAPSTYISTCTLAASTTTNVTLVLAECGMNTGL